MKEEAGSSRSTPDGFRFRGARVDSHEGCESEVGKVKGRVAGEVNRVWGEDEVYNGVIIQIFEEMIMRYKWFVRKCGWG